MQLRSYTKSYTMKDGKEKENAMETTPKEPVVAKPQ